MISYLPRSPCRQLAHQDRLHDALRLDRLGQLVERALVHARARLVLAGATLSGGFSMPPDVAPLPPFRTWEPIAAGRLEHYDGLVLGTVNAVLAAQGAKPLSRLSELLHGDLPLLCTWPELDHYGRDTLPEGQSWLGPNILPSAGKAPPTWPAGDGPCVFAYVRGTHPDHLALLQALAQAGCRTLCYMPEVGAGQPVPLASPLIHYATSAVNLREALPQAQFTVCHAGEATIAQSLMAGVPLLLMPMQAEQYLMACRGEALGVCLNAAARPRPTPFKAMIDALLHQPSYRAAAQTVAQRYAGFSHEAQVETIATLVASLSEAYHRPAA
jgi:hypothetical protein